MITRSVSFRLILLSVTWIAAALIIGGVVLAAHFRAHVERTFDAELVRHAEEILTLIDVQNGTAHLSRPPANPAYHRPLSGWYWQVQIRDLVEERSRSLWDEALMMPQAVPEVGETAHVMMNGPRDQALRAVARSFSLPNMDAPVTIVVTGPASDIEDAVHEFNEPLRVSLIVLGLGLGLAVVVQVWLGLRPLDRVRRRLADVHAGRTKRMDGSYPSEVQPLVDDLNDLLAHNAEVIERARTHAGNLAHALKTPLAVLGNEADKLEGTQAKTVKDQLSVMNDHITRHLTRARASGGLGAPGAVTDVGDVAESLARTLEKIYADKGVTIALYGLKDLTIKAERQDVEEMLGNLMDNACKWAKGEVRITGRTEGGDVLVCVDDDGPGIEPDQRDAALGRGKRLDESTPGSGLGLSIVAELAGLNHGEVQLETAKTGGLSARLRLKKG